MKKLETFIESHADFNLLKIDGPLNEYSILPTSDLLKGKKLIIDLKELIFLNSEGIRIWIRWVVDVVSVTAEKSFTVKNCPRIFINQINMIANMLPAKAKVESFYIPYYCAPCDFFTDKLVTDNSNSLPQVVCPKCGKQMSADIIPKKYFGFQKK